MAIATLHAVQTPDAPCASLDELQHISHEAARYAVLRRMASAVRHQIAGALQPVSMLASLLERRAQAEPPNMASLRKNASEIGGLSRSASRECVSLMDWVAPQLGELVPIGEGVEDCLHLLGTELSFRGFSIVNLTADHDALVVRAALRTVLPACLMALTDNAARTAEVVVSTHSTTDKVIVSLMMTPVALNAAPVRAKAYRALTWSDVQVLADDEGVVVHKTELSVELVLSRQEHQPADSLDERWG